MKKLLILLIAVFFLHLDVQAVMAGSDCPEVDDALLRVIYYKFPSYEIALHDRMSEEERQKLIDLHVDTCPYIVEIDTSTLMLVLKEKGSGNFIVVLAVSSAEPGHSSWIVDKVDTFQSDMPVLQKARGGFYLDVTTRKKMIITRTSLAVQANCLGTGSQYIFKILHDGKVERCRIK